MLSLNKRLKYCLLLIQLSIEKLVNIIFFHCHRLYGILELKLNCSLFYFMRRHLNLPSYIISNYNSIFTYYNLIYNYGFVTKNHYYLI